jgi:hypothetical protein
MACCSSLAQNNLLNNLLNSLLLFGHVHGCGIVLCRQYNNM